MVNYSIIIMLGSLVGFLVFAFYAVAEYGDFDGVFGVFGAILGLAVTSTFFLFTIVMNGEKEYVLESKGGIEQFVENKDGSYSFLAKDEDGYFYGVNTDAEDEVYIGVVKEGFGYECYEVRRVWWRFYDLGGYKVYKFRIGEDEFKGLKVRFWKE